MEQKKNLTDNKTHMSVNFSSLSYPAVTPSGTTAYSWNTSLPSPSGPYDIVLNAPPSELETLCFVQNTNLFDVSITFDAVLVSYDYYDTDPVIRWGYSPDDTGTSLNQLGIYNLFTGDTLTLSNQPVVVPANQYLYFDNNNPSGFSSIQITLTSITAADIPCLCKGMLLHTPTGPRPVEDLQPEDLVVTPDCRRVPVVRVFHTSVPSSNLTRPYRIPRGFCGDKYPIWDVLLSPHHAFFDFRDQQWKEPCETPGLHQESEDDTPAMIDYYHVQLPNHETDKLVCFNLGVDSYLENHPL